MASDSDSESIYMNVDDADKDQIYNNIHLNMTTEIPASAGACGRRKMNVGNTAAAALGFLCVLLLAVITVLCVKHNKQLHQIQSDNDNMTVERNGLQSRYDNMTVERDRLQSRYDIMTVERDTLQSQNNRLTSERNQLQSSYNTLKSEKDALQKKLAEIGSCLSGWTKFLSSCYLVSSHAKTWHESRQDCISTGADLVIINSGEEQLFVSGLGKNVWIGLTDVDQEGKWTWVDKTPLESSFWRTSEPNNAGDEDCVEVLPQYGYFTAVISNWNDNPCSRHLPGLCEKKIQCSP